MALMKNARTILMNRLLSNPKRTCHNNVIITASPRVSLNDVLPRIQVKGLDPKTAVTLKAELFDDKGYQFLSHAYYESNETGDVDVTVSHSIGGSYEGLFPSGLISCLKICHDKFKYGEIVHNDIQQPLYINITVHEGHQSLRSNVPSLDQVKLVRHFASPGVKRIAVRDGNVRGVLFIPAGDGVFPGVVEMYGANSYLRVERGALLASRGIACLCLAYSDYEDIPASRLHSHDIEYFEETTEYLTQHPQVISDRCGVIGNCTGGTRGGAMIVHIDKVKAMFGINFFNKHFGSFTCKGEEMFDVEGESLGLGLKTMFVPTNDDPDVRVLNDNLIRSGCQAEGTFVKHLYKVSKEKYFSYAFGEADTYGTRGSLIGIEEAVQNDFETNFEIKSYPSAGHVVKTPYCQVVTESPLRFESPSGEIVTFINSWGGTEKGISDMQADVWYNMQKFINFHIRDNSLWYQNHLRGI